jgi:hypothetical protein
MRECACYNRRCALDARTRGYKPGNRLALCRPTRSVLVCECVCARLCVCVYVCVCVHTHHSPGCPLSHRCALEAAQKPSQAQNMQQIPGACWQTHAHAPARPTAQRPPCSAEDGKAPRVRGACEHHRARGTTGCRWRRSPTRRRWRPKCIGGCLPPAPSATPTTVTNSVASVRVLARSLVCMHARARTRAHACTYARTPRAHKRRASINQLFVSLATPTHPSSSLHRSLPPLSFPGSPLSHLYYSNNRLCTLPHWISELCNLETLALGNNRLRELQSAMGKCRKLKN